MDQVLLDELKEEDWQKIADVLRQFEIGLPSDETAHQLDPSLSNEDLATAIFKAQTFDELIAIAWAHVLRDIGDRLAALKDTPFEAARGEQPLDVESVRSFVLYCARRRQPRRPLMTATPDGILQADWRLGAEHRFSIRFFAEGKIQVAIREPQFSGSFSTALAYLLEGRAPVGIPRWA